MGVEQSGLLPASPAKGEAQDQNGSSDPESQDLTGMKEKIHGLISQFLEGIGYNGPTKGEDFDGLIQGMHDQARDLGIPYPEGSKPWYSFIVGLHYARVCYCLILPGKCYPRLIIPCGASHQTVLLP